jgi:hypothetical protein
MPAIGLRSRILQAWKDRPRRRQMIVTDVTRMDGDRICVGGYLDDGTAIRPVADRIGPNEQWLRSARDGRVAPFTVLDLQVNKAPKRLSAPHTEDRTIPLKGHRVLSTLPEEEQRALLERTMSSSVRSVFGAEIHADPAGQWGRYVRSGEGTRSLGTIQTDRVEAVGYHHYPERGRWDYRLRFRDGSGEEFQLAVVDLAFRARLDALCSRGFPADRAATEVLTALRRQTVFVRIGLARGWDRHPDRCYLQITGVYGFSA